MSLGIDKYIKHLSNSAYTMEIKDLRPNKGNVDLVAEVVTKDSPRSFEKFGKSGRVCNAVLKDPSGQVTLTLWNDDIEKVNIGDKVHLQNGWCSEYQGKIQLSTGKFGKIDIMGSDSGTVLTNDPTVFKQVNGDTDDESTEEGAEAGPLGDEEFIE